MKRLLVASVVLCALCASCADGEHHPFITLPDSPADTVYVPAPSPSPSPNPSPSPSPSPCPRGHRPHR